MKVIALKGEKDSGKSTTLKEVYKILKAAGGTTENYNCDDWLERTFKEFRDVIHFADKKIGIVLKGHGDVVTENSLINQLIILKNQGCDIAICACTTGKNIEATIINNFPENKFIDKKKSKDESLQQIENTHKARCIIDLLSDFLNAM